LNTISSVHNFNTSSAQQSFFSESYISNSAVSSRIAEIDALLENIFSVDKRLSPVVKHQVLGMQREMGKIHAKYNKTDKEISPLDALRLLHFQERIDALYGACEPSSKDFIYAEALIEERAKLLA